MTQASLSALLSQALIGFTIRFDRELARRTRSLNLHELPPSLAMWQNALRFITEDGVEERRLTELSGVAAPTMRTMLACLQRHGWIDVEPDAAPPRRKRIRLSAAGRAVADLWMTVLRDVEGELIRCLDPEARTSLERALDEVVKAANAGALPHYPMAMPHRGGLPSGA